MKPLRDLFLYAKKALLYRCNSGQKATATAGGCSIEAKYGGTRGNDIRIIISKNIDDTLVKKYKSEYSNIEFKNIEIFHDRFIIIDRKKLYSCGASFKDLGKKCFAINEMESEELISNLLSKIFK